MNTERLLKLAAFLRKLPPERFDFGVVVNHNTPRCGTVGCAVGWSPAVFPDLVEWNDRENLGLRLINAQLPIDPYYDYDDLASELFDIPLNHAMDLFSPNCQENLGLENRGTCSSPSQVADLIEDYIKLKS